MSHVSESDDLAPRSETAVHSWEHLFGCHSGATALGLSQAGKKQGGRGDLQFEV